MFNVTVGCSYLAASHGCVCLSVCHSLQRRAFILDLLCLFGSGVRRWRPTTPDCHHMTPQWHRSGRCPVDSAYLLSSSVNHINKQGTRGQRWRLMFSLCRSLSAMFPNGRKYCLDTRKKNVLFGVRVESRTLHSLRNFPGKDRFTSDYSSWKAQQRSIFTPGGSVHE